MKKMVRGILLIFTATLAFPVLAGGHLRIINTTSSHINVKCGHDGHAGSAHDIEHDHSRRIDIYGHGDVHCKAYNSHGDVISSRSFDYEHSGSSYTWRVARHH